MASLSISQAWNETAAFMKREAGLILPIALLLLAVPGAAMQLAMPPAPAPGQTPEAGAWLLLIPVVMFASIVGTVAISFLALRPGTSVGEGLQVGLRRFLPVFIASLLIGLAALLVMIPLAAIFMGGAIASGNPTAAGGSLLLFLLLATCIALAFWVRLMLMTPVAAAENAGPIAIIRRSWALTAGHFWKLLGLVLLMLIVAMVVIFAISALVGIFVFMLAGPPDPGSTSFILMTILSALLSAIFSAIFVTLLARVYAQLSGSVPTEAVA
ncbi:MAG TPA: glycerophosphoryl diester phosphodiesterase membrane domain-containing protein [Allosphingosinicella sp.]|nr:glycerophosphoryl diester phosphodiesterase membrane domain-containing protein [Allosphingosinicella sp.]